MPCVEAYCAHSLRSVGSGLGFYWQQSRQPRHQLTDHGDVERVSAPISATRLQVLTMR